MRTPVLTFHSDPPGSSYFRSCAARLVADCRRLSLPVVTRELPWIEGGTWAATNRRKARVIADFLAEPGRPVLWVDADSRILRDPGEIIDRLTCDFAAVKQQLPGRPDIPVLATVLYFGCSARARQFAQEWARACEHKTAVGNDHDVLVRVLEQAHGLSHQVLDERLCEVPGHAPAGLAPYVRFGLSHPPWQKHVRTVPPITATITTCRRLKHLARLLESVERHVVDRYLVDRWIVVDDGSEEADLVEMAERWPFLDIVRNDLRGHVNAVNLLYSLVETPLVLYLEDDWEFTRADLLIHDAYSVLLEDRHVKSVGFRSWSCPHRRTGSAVTYQEHCYLRGRAGRRSPGSDAFWPGFTLNPSLQVMEAVRQVLPATMPEFEFRMALAFHRKGFRCAHLDPGAVKHTGDGQSAYALTGASR
jgi:hypothetical protein